MGTAAIIGARGGLGRYLSARFVKEGWTTVAGVRPGSLTDGATEGTTEFDIDLRDDDSIDAFLDSLGETPRAIVQCAVLYPANGAEVNRSEFLEAVLVNAWGPYYLTRRLAERVQADPQEGCSLVFINSDSTLHADSRSGPYAATKAALKQLTSAIASLCAGSALSASTLLVGPLAVGANSENIDRIVESTGRTRSEIERRYVAIASPGSLLTELIDPGTCWTAIRGLIEMGRAANGAVIRIDGGAAGSWA